MPPSRQGGIFVYQFRLERDSDSSNIAILPLVSPTLEMGLV